MDKLKVIECPRDAMQGLHDFIPTELKVKYINQLLKVGFDTIDFGSFVSPKAIPQMRDTAEVLKQLDLSQTQSKLLAIVANKRGATDASQFEEIDYLGYPFSISETFQQRNTNASIEESLGRLEEIVNITQKAKKELVVYISMGFGNPYGDAWSPELVTRWSERLYKELGINILALSDTIGVANPEIITQLFTTLIPALPEVEFGAHLHSTPTEYTEKVKSAYEAGCRRYDGAIKGFGGCPMAKDDLTGNMPTEGMLHWFDKHGIETGLDLDAFRDSLDLSLQVFPV
ncbi:hydroxymethylglutaryl-CoA lyase [Lishizhenia tianjinensis]|uniref:Hydroxymethylglutaryl-CoA lyase n=1 Tax=Lishizhenia tianjinensis TaxID=477690 RepID=A0A1I6Y7Z1_9FLAO|nr:hydroxymethylglutaryl-CoA lyase [Lishizhenia tianjinensis]SFT46618.1 hydroxymethylglutaryl-CoA lyase [Lishizhenia tianjinensis]